MNATNLLLMLVHGLSDNFDTTPYCGPFEVYQGVECAPTCDRTCSNVNATCPPQIGPSAPGCFCTEGYARDENRICIPINECPPICRGPHEVYYPECNAPKCEQFCRHWGYACEGESHAGCFCAKGYARDYRGLCIPIGQCMYSCAGDSEIFDIQSSIGGICTRICTKYGDIVCDYDYKSSTGCSCAYGYVRNENGDCISPTQCQLNCSNP